MILADTSVWVDHFRAANPRFQKLLTEGSSLMHPFVIGELACGNLPRRAESLHFMRQLPSAEMGEHDEVLRLLEERPLWGRGIGWIDAHLLVAALLTGCELWTLDRPLREAAIHLQVAAAG